VVADLCSCSDHEGRWHRLTVHRDAPLTPEGRLRPCNLIEDGRSLAAVAESVWISRQTAHKVPALGWPAPEDRPSLRLLPQQQRKPGIMLDCFRLPTVTSGPFSHP
jgi:hypothetical protein